MLETTLKLLKKIEEHGFAAYIVGGFVRDKLIGRETSDIDVTTNATPKDLLEIFKDGIVKQEEYGSVTVLYKKIKVEITTFRKEINYLNNRKPVEFKFINSLDEDLKRRDFTMNTLCMDSNGNIIDLLNCQNDIKNKIIKTVGNSNEKFSEDVLRILRAVRFATQLNFELSTDVREAINLNKYLLKTLSYNRKREELDKIFLSTNVKYGIKLLKELSLLEVLEIDNIVNVNCFDDILGVWAIIDNDNYPFTKNEKHIIKEIKAVLQLDILDRYTLYHYGLYICTICANIKKIDLKIINKEYGELPITSKKDLNITGEDILKVLNIKPSNKVKEVFTDIEYEVLYGKLKNNKRDIVKYIEKNYK